MSDLIVWILVGALLLIVLILMVVLFGNMRANKRIDNDNVQRQVSEQLSFFQNNLLSAMRQDMNLFNENTTQRLQSIEKNVNEHLNTNYKATNETIQSVMKEIVKIDETQHQLKVLSHDITGLHRIFNDKKTRGIYGEIELYTLLESAFGDNPSRFSKQYRLREGGVVDAVIYGNDALGIIPIDSKFPLENFNRLQEGDSTPAHKSVLQNEFKNDVKKHIQSIAQKYINPPETSEFAYMFIPAEAIFSYINAHLPEVVQYSYEKKVYLVSPTTLMAYITAIKALYLNQKKNEKTAEIQVELGKLSVEFSRFTKRYEAVQRDFTRTTQEMQDVLISAQKIAKRFEKIEHVEWDESQS